MTGQRPVPRMRTTPETAGSMIGCSGKTLRRRFKDDPSSVPYMYNAGKRVWVSTPKLHAALHGTDLPWYECPGCWLLGPEPRSEVVQWPPAPTS